MLAGAGALTGTRREHIYTHTQLTTPIPPTHLLKAVFWRPCCSGLLLLLKMSTRRGVCSCRGRPLSRLTSPGTSGAPWGTDASCVPDRAKQVRELGIRVLVVGPIGNSHRAAGCRPRQWTTRTLHTVQA